MSNGTGIPNGAVLVYQGVWPTVDVITLAEIGGIVTAVTAALVKDGLLVLSESDDASAITELFKTSFSITLKLQVENGLGYAQAADVISIIRHEVFQATGEFPFSDSIPQISFPSSAPTAALDLTAPSGSPAAPGALEGIRKKVSGFFSGLASTTGISIGLVGLGLVLAVLLIFRFGRQPA